jgi:hypothetical protein
MLDWEPGENRLLDVQQKEYLGVCEDTPVDLMTCKKAKKVVFGSDGAA